MNFYLLAIAALFFAALVVMELAGRRVRAVRAANERHAQSEDDSIGYVLTSTFGLLALLIGFTFSVALGRYEDRREDVITEANAIGTAYFRTEFVSGPEKQRLQELLRTYATVRIAYGRADFTERAPLAAQSEQVRQAISRSAHSALSQLSGSPAAPSLAAAINETLDIGTQREANMEARVPLMVIWVLLISSCAAAFMIGYARKGTSRSRMLANQLLFLLLCAAITMILDLDYPAMGSILIDQSPMESVGASLTG